MSRIINTENPGRLRKSLSVAILYTVRELNRKAQSDDEAQDMLAFVVISLRAIYNSIETTVQAWEKRGYWLKADRFRMEWDWAGFESTKLASALAGERWVEIAEILVRVSVRLKNVQLPAKPRLFKPWLGCRGKLSEAN